MADSDPEECAPARAVVPASARRSRHALPAPASGCPTLPVRPHAHADRRLHSTAPDRRPCLRADVPRRASPGATDWRLPIARRWQKRRQWRYPWNSWRQPLARQFALRLVRLRQQPLRKINALLKLVQPPNRALELEERVDFAERLL